MTPVARSVARPASQGVALLALVGGLFLASAGLIAIRFAQQDGMPTSLIVMLRLAIGTLVFTPLTLPRHLPRIRRMPRRALLLLLLASISLCADLMLFVEAIKYVNILLATIIISLMPLITALMERYLLKAPLQRSMYVGMVLAIGGVLIIAFGSSSGDADLGRTRRWAHCLPFSAYSVPVRISLLAASSGHVFRSCLTHGCFLVPPRLFQ